MMMNLKRKALYLSMVGGLLPFVTAGAGFAGTIGATSAAPNSAQVGVATTVTVTSLITDPSVIPGSVVLQSLDSGGRVIAVLGTLHDDGLNGDTAANDHTYTAQTTVYQTSPGSVTLRVSAGFKGSLLRVSSAPLPVNVTGTSIGINILSPPNLSYVSTSPVNVTGKVGDPAAQVTVNGISAPVTGGQFLATIPLVEGLNTLTAVATNTGGIISDASVQVTLDTTPPHITIDSPTAGTNTTASSVTVSGTANDVVVGTVNSGDVQVTVNGIPAQVANRTYSAANVPLTLGINTIQAIGRDRAGNGTTVAAMITRVLASQPPTPAIGLALITSSLSLVSGNNQTGAIGTQLPAPLVVSLTNSSGQPIANQPVVFAVTGNNGTVRGGGPAASSAVVNTGTNGQAQVFWSLGQRSGAGINTVHASSVLAVGSADFTATGTTSSAVQINVDSGNNQTGALGQPLAFPFVAAVTDSGHNRVPNVPVTLTVTQGGGNMGGLPSQTVNTDSNGRAIAVLTLGTQPGNDNNVVQASFPGNPGSPAAFSASAKAPGNPANTTISGVVFDNSNNPIQNVTMRLFLTNQGNNNNLPVQIGTPVQTTAQGTFSIQPVPVGFFKLMADGSTALGPKSYPTLEYDIVTVAGQDNTVGMPMYLPALDPVNKLCVDATHGGTLTLPQSPGFALTVLPGSATFPGGSRTGCISVTPVNGDKVPMAPGFGQQPRFIVTIQPVGTTFNPPAPITLPNVDGLSPRAVTEMYSYDHDLSMFVAIGTGTVSTDGSVIASNPGVGVLKAGWHCGGDPNANGTVADCPTCQFCQNNACVKDPAQDQKQCSQGGQNGCCLGGACTPWGPPLPANNPLATLNHTLGGASNPGANFGLTVVTIGQQGVTGPTFDISAFVDGTNWAFRVNSISHTYLVGINGQGDIDITGPNDPAITAAQPGCPAPCAITKAAVIADLTPPAPGTPNGPPRTKYWSSVITRAHEQCHVDRFYTDARFWPKYMKMFEDAVEAERTAILCSDPNAASAAATIAAHQATWQASINDLHGQADAAEIGGSEVACHGVSNPMYTALINSIP